MSIVKKLMAGALAVSFVSLPVAAQASASKLSLSKGVRAGKSVGSAEHVRGSGFLAPALALAAVVAGALVLSDSDDSPRSP